MDESPPLRPIRGRFRVARHGVRSPDVWYEPALSAPQGNTGFIDNRGKAVIAPRFEAALPYSEGLAAVKREGRWGYIDRNGLEVIPIRYRTVQSFRNGVAIVDTVYPISL